MKELSVIIVNWNTKNVLKNCIISIYKTVKKIEFEVIVVDNGSTDGSAEMIRKEFPYVKLIENRRNRGFAAANNQAIKKAEGAFILLLNSDTVVLDNAIEKTLSFIKNKKDAGAVGCKLLNADYSLQPSCYNFYSFFKRAILRKIPKFLIPSKYYKNLESLIISWGYDEIRDVDYVRGAFLMVRNTIFDEIGLFDESFFMYGEEEDLCYRMKNAGWKVYFYPDAQIIHLKGASVKKKETEILQRVVTDMLFLKKHHSLCSYLTIRFLVITKIMFGYIIQKLLNGETKETKFLDSKLKVVCSLTYLY
ncbi:MAG: hypothetical protein B5M53_00480 [Candidatus Cloacimonas sp. 4484_209]|nr:MAG: hypothetical protein B5M53_00480 [Candidatus Cloacimonas sp. 4484_209]